MAIIYSYPRVNTLNGSDLLIGTRFENEFSDFLVDGTKFHPEV